MDTLTAPRSAHLDVVDPATDELLGTIPAGDPEAADAAVRAARQAQGAWARTPAGERSGMLKAAARRLRAHVDELAELQTRENGKPLGDSRGGVEAGIGAIEQYAELGPLHRGRSLQGAWGATDLMVPEPRGVCALLVPWNDPIAIACGQLAACLAAGNAVVLKPSEKTPLSTRRLVELLHADLPEGVLQLLLGDVRAGRPLAAHPGVDLVIHTGSVATGREVAVACAQGLRKALLELGGKDPLIVDAGVDPAWAAAQAAAGAFANAGQICTSVERIYVHEAVAGPFLEALAERARSLRVGPGLDPRTEMGPLVDDDQRDWVHQHVQDALQNGAELLAGGELPDGEGSFYPPTVLVGAPADAPVLCHETFGPVAAVRVVSSFDEALAEAGRTEYGLAATVLTPSHANAQRDVVDRHVSVAFSAGAEWGCGGALTSGSGFH